MRAKAIIFLYLLVGLINFIPILGVTGRAKLEALYGASFSSADLLLLMQHRALLLGIVGAFLLVAAFHPAFRPMAAIAGMASMVGFDVLYLIVPGVSGRLAGVATIDAVAVVLLAVAIGLDYRRVRNAIDNH
ncbi:MAG: phosphopantetheine adenylyltransferase [Alphaproteobacteria bacterium]|nr:phosphopantetheine adenylyltransferase [Alphaproteobacteria bacterium]